MERHNIAQKMDNEMYNPETGTKKCNYCVYTNCQ